MEMAKEKSSEKGGGDEMPSLIGVKSTEKLFRLLRDAETRTGKNRSDIINRLVEDHIEDVVRLILEEEHRRIGSELAKVKAKPLPK
jgi:hypothetical protein